MRRTMNIGDEADEVGMVYLDNIPTQAAQSGKPHKLFTSKPNSVADTGEAMCFLIRL